MASREEQIEQVIKQIDDRLEELRAIEQALLDLHNRRVLNGVDQAERAEEEH